MNQMCWWKAGITSYVCLVVGKTPPSSSASTQPLPETPVLTRSSSQTPPAGVTATTSAASTVSAPSAATGSPVKKQRPLLPKETAPAVQRVVWNSSNKFQTSSQKWHMQKVQRQQQQSQQSQSQQPQSSQGTRYQTRQAVKGTHFSNSYAKAINYSTCRVYQCHLSIYKWLPVLSDKQQIWRVFQSIIWQQWNYQGFGICLWNPCCLTRLWC